jgi:hypothetical protein
LPFKVCKPPISNEMSSRGFGGKFLDLQNWYFGIYRERKLLSLKAEAFSSFWFNVVPQVNFHTFTVQ